MNLYFYSFIPVILFIILFALKEKNVKVKCLLLSLTCIFLGTMIISLLIPFKNMIFFYQLLHIYYIIFCIIEYSVHYDTIRKNNVIADFTEQLLHKVTPVFIAVILFSLLPLISYYFKFWEKAAFFFNVIGFFATAFLYFVLCSYCTNYHLFEWRGVENKKYTFNVLSLTALFMLFDFSILKTISDYFIVFIFLNAIIIVRLCHAFYLGTIEKLENKIIQYVDYLNFKNNLIGRMTSCTEKEEQGIVEESIKAFFEKLKSLQLERSYKFTGLSVYQKIGDNLTVRSKEYIHNYIVPIDYIGKEIIKKMDSKGIEQLILRNPINMKRQKLDRYVKEIIENKIEIKITANEVSGLLVQCILLVPIIENGKIIGVLDFSKRDHTEIYYEERILISELIEDLKTIFIISEGKRAQKEKERMQKELTVARNLQMSILPKKIEMEGYDCHAIMIPATEVGGDMYDYVRHNGHTYIAIGDVEGHGLPSGIRSLIMNIYFNTYVKLLDLSGDNENKNMEKIYTIANEIIYNANKKIGDDRMMTQIFLSEQDGKFIHVGAHTPTIHYHAETSCTEILNTYTNAPYLGLLENIDSKRSIGNFKMLPGDIVMLYTDGLIEARNKERKTFDVSNCEKILKENADKTSEEIINVFIDSVYQYAVDGDLLINGGSLSDDLSILILKRE